MRQVGLRHKKLWKTPNFRQPCFPNAYYKCVRKLKQIVASRPKSVTNAFSRRQTIPILRLVKSLSDLNVFTSKFEKCHIFFWQGYFTLWRNGNVFRHKSQMTFPFPIMVQCVRMSQKIGLEGTKFEKTKYVAFRNFRYIYKRCGGERGTEF